jgi:CAAX protease family protein
METSSGPAPWAGIVWTLWVVAALLALTFATGGVYLLVVFLSALVLCLTPGTLPSTVRRSEPRDLLAIGLLYLAVVALMRLAFVGFTQDHVAGLFLSFGSALVLGVAGPVIYTVWIAGRSLADLGLRRDDLPRVAGLALLFGGVQYALTLWGYDFPAAGDWVPLLCMALVVGVFESVFFRGFVQGSLEAQFGSPVAIAVAAVLYGGYHVGYGMGGEEILFLTGLGVVYAAAFALARNLLVLWPLLTPLGSFYANLDAGDIDLPWASIAGFVDVLIVMVVVGWLGYRKQRRTHPAKDDSPATAHHQ